MLLQLYTELESFTLDPAEAVRNFIDILLIDVNSGKLI